MNGPEPVAVERVAPASVADLHALAGRELGPTAWHAVTQARVDAFAAATDDFQWIHVDVERATASALGGTIAHGLYTLSLGPQLAMELMAFDGFAQSLNYGYEKVRFPAPLPVGSRLRMRATLTDVRDFPGGAQISIAQSYECDRAAKPVCVAVAVSRFYEHTA